MNLTYEEFLAKLESIGIDTHPYLPFNLDHLFLYAGESKTDKRKARKAREETPIIIRYCKTGGAQGGSCWGDEAQSYSISKGDRSYEGHSLEEVADNLFPEMTRREYKALWDKVVKHGCETYYEYYGNYDDYSYEVILAKELYDELVNMGLISS